MKTSDKIILFSMLALLAIFITIHWQLFAAYKAGIILTQKDLDRDDFAPQSGEQPTTLILEGPIRTDIIPSDKWHFDFDKQDIKRLHYRQSGDSLIISTDDYLQKNPHLVWVEFMSYPLVHVYCPTIKGIRVRSGFAVLRTITNQPDINASFDLDRAQLWIGSFNPNDDLSIPMETYDSINIRAINSSIIFNRQCHVKSFDLRADDQTEIRARFPVIDTAHILGGKNTAIFLRGLNFNKIRWEMADK